MTQTSPAVGVIGLGYGRAHIPALQVNGRRVVAVCQRDRANAKKVADRYGVPQIFERWKEMLEVARPEIVVIATPPHLHRWIVRWSLHFQHCSRSSMCPSRTRSGPASIRYNGGSEPSTR